MYMATLSDRVNVDPHNLRGLRQEPDHIQNVVNPSTAHRNCCQKLIHCQPVLIRVRRHTNWWTLDVNWTICSKQKEHSNGQCKGHTERELVSFWRFRTGVFCHWALSILSPSSWPLVRYHYTPYTDCVRSYCTGIVHCDIAYFVECILTAIPIGIRPDSGSPRCPRRCMSIGMGSMRQIIGPRGRMQKDMM